MWRVIPYIAPVQVDCRENRVSMLTLHCSTAMGGRLSPLWCSRVSWVRYIIPHRDTWMSVISSVSIGCICSLCFQSLKPVSPFFFFLKLLQCSFLSPHVQAVWHAEKTQIFQIVSTTSAFPIDDAYDDYNNQEDYNPKSTAFLMWDFSNFVEENSLNDCVIDTSLEFSNVIFHFTVYSFLQFVSLFVGESFLEVGVSIIS